MALPLLHRLLIVQVPGHPLHLRQQQPLSSSMLILVRATSPLKVTPATVMTSTLGTQAIALSVPWQLSTKRRLLLSTALVPSSSRPFLPFQMWSLWCGPVSRARKAETDSLISYTGRPLHRESFHILLPRQQATTAQAWFRALTISLRVFTLTTVTLTKQPSRRATSLALASVSFVHMSSSMLILVSLYKFHLLRSHHQPVRRSCT